VQLLQQTLVAAALFFLYTHSVNAKKEHFINKISDISNQILEGIKQERNVTFRKNFLRLYKEPQPKSQLLLPFCSVTGYFDTYYLKSSTDKEMLTKNVLYTSGQIYIQGLSSMLTVYELDPKPNENVIDLCAAPGSKTSLIADLAQNKAKITAIENNSARLHAMKANMATLNVQDVTFIRTNAALLGRNPLFIHKFDKVLADVPCSNEGLIRDIDNYDFSKWNPKLSQHLPKLQKRILASGLTVLKPGGTLVYSTCTYSPEENELVVNWALKKFSDVYLADLSIKLENSTPGFTCWKKKNMHPSLSKTIRILPNDLFDGFYIAKFVKS
jgi:16S rRNA (cytosine1407-C5)-methyltransferase